MLQAASLLITTLIVGREELRGPHTGGRNDLLVGLDRWRMTPDVVEFRDSDSEPESEGAAGQ